MKIKLVKEFNSTPKDSIVEVDEVTFKTLTTDGTAVEYNEAMELVEKKNAIVEVAKTVQIITGKTKMSTENMLGKAFRAIYEGKAVTGMSEGVAADGGNLLGTAVSEIMGIAIDGSKVWSKCKKLTLPDRTNSIKVPIDSSDPWITTSVPVPSYPGEGIQKTATKLTFGLQTLTLGKTVFYIPVTDELLADVGVLDQYVRQYAFSKLAGTLDNSCLSGAASYSGVMGNGTYTATTNVSATPTMDQIFGIVQKVDPRLNPEWYMGPANWYAMKGAFADADNIGNQLINVNGMQLAGYKVNVLPQLNGMVLGDFSQYVVAVPRVNDIMQVSEHVRWEYDESVFRLVHRSAGAPAWTARSAADGTVIGAFSQKA